MRKNNKRSYTIKNSKHTNSNFVTVINETYRRIVSLTQVDYYNSPSYIPQSEVNLLHFNLADLLTKHEQVHCYEVLDRDTATQTSVSHYVLPSQVPSLKEVYNI